MSKLIATVNKSDRDDIRISLSDFKGKKYIDIRNYFQSEDGGDMIPTKKGINFKVGLYPEFKKAIQILENLLLEKGLIDKEELV